MTVNKETGRVGFNSSGLTEAQLADPGVQALIAMVDQPVTYFYASDSKASTRTQSTKIDENGQEVLTGKPGEVVIRDLDNPKRANGISNTSREPYWFKTLNGEPANFTEIPGNLNYSGQVVISPNTTYVEPGTEIPVSRESVILHECLEMVERTGNGNRYQVAHDNASNRVRSLPTSDPRYAKKPGEASSRIKSN